MKKNKNIIAMLLIFNALPIQAQNPESNSLLVSIWNGTTSIVSSLGSSLTSRDSHLSTTSKITIACGLTALAGYFSFKFYKRQERERQERERQIEEAPYREKLISVKHNRFCYTDNYHPIETYKKGYIPINIIFDNQLLNDIRKKNEGTKQYELNAFLTAAISSMISSNAMHIMSRDLSDLLLHLLIAEESNSGDSKPLVEQPMMNYLYPKKSNSDDIKKLKQQINESNWSCLYTHDSDLAVWVPKKYQNEYTSVLQVEDLIHVPINDVKTIVKQTEKDYDGKRESKPQQLIKLFIPNPGYTLNILLTGHGLSHKGHETMGQMPLGDNLEEEKRITSFLSFLNDNMKVGVLSIASCMAGGTNKDLLFKRKSHYHYPLIIAGHSDKSITLQFPRIAPTFFKNALKGSLEEICYGLHYTREGFHDLHGYAAHPVVLKPERTSFTFVKRPTDAETVRIGHLSKDPSKWGTALPGKKFVTLESSRCKDRLVLSRFKVENAVKHKRNIDMSPVWKHLPIYWNEQLTMFPNEMYPEIGYVGKSNKIEFSDAIIVLSTPIPGGTKPKPGSNKSGILQFLRESFCNTQCVEARTIKIANLVGINDISTQMRRARKAKKTNSAKILPKQRCEALFEKTEGEEIALSDTEVKIKNGQITFTIKHPDTKQVFKWTVDVKPKIPSTHPAWNFQ